MTQTESHLETREDIAGFLQISTRSVDNLIRRGCPLVRLSPRCVRFDRVSVKSWLESGGAMQPPVKRKPGRPKNVDRNS